jgi:hypothetical protein
MPFDFLAPKDFKIIWLSNILGLSVPDEGYSKNVWRALNLISMFLLHLENFEHRPPLNIYEIFILL